MQVSVRNISTWLVANVLIGLGFVRFAKPKALKGDYILSIYFHNPSKIEFEKCIHWLKKNNFQFLSTSDIENIIEKSLPIPKGGVLLTIDDGWQSNEENVIAVANKHNVPVTLFVATEPVEKGVFWWSYFEDDSQVINKGPAEALKKVTNKERLQNIENLKDTINIKREALTIEQLKNAAYSPFITIGSHSHTHPILVNCTEEEVRSELQLSRQKLEEWTGKKVNYFSYPNGDYSLREIKMLEEMNYKLAFTDNDEYLTSLKINERYKIPRFCFVEGASFAENLCRMLGVWKFSKKWMRKRIFLKNSFHNLIPI